MHSHITIHPSAYAPLLAVIAEGESRGNYNAYFGNAANKEMDFTRMTVAEVLAWQANYVKEGSPSSAVGRYQIIQPTLETLIKELNLTTNELFDKALQDKLAITLMERRGSIEFIKRSVSAEEFAHNLSREWAALPRVTGESPEESYYAGDGLNKALVSRSAVLRAIEEFKQQAAK